MKAKKDLEHFFKEDKQIAIFGLGVSGLSALKLLATLYPQLKSKLHVVNEGEIKNWKQLPQVLKYVEIKNCHSEDGPDTSHLLSVCSFIILSPGVASTHPSLQKAHLFNVPLWSEIELGFCFVTNPIIAITGTNGKTTTTTMLGDILKNACKKVFVGGNIGVPLCDYALQDEFVDCVVLELSSFQLESIHHFKADIAMILNLSLNHGERYSSLDSYGEAKWRVTNHMAFKDFLLFDESCDFLINKIKKVPFSTWGIKTKRVADLKSIFQKKYDLTSFQLVGDHNFTNLFFAVKAAELFFQRFFPGQNEEDILKEAVAKTIKDFAGVPHRIQKIPCSKKYLAFNDAKSTNWDATLTAVSAVYSPLSPLWLIVGGQPRGQGEEMESFLKEVKGKISLFLSFGESSNFVEKEIFDTFPLKKFRTLADVIKFVDQENFQGTLLFSPAFPSFDQYKNYAERGEHFIKLLNL